MSSSNIFRTPTLLTTDHIILGAELYLHTQKFCVCKMCGRFENIKNEEKKQNDNH